MTTFKKAKKKEKSKTFIKISIATALYFQNVELEHSSRPLPKAKNVQAKHCQTKSRNPFTFTPQSTKTSFIPSQKHTTGPSWL